MTEQVFKMRIQLRRAKTSEWEQYKHLVPAEGEPCFDTELGTLKIGNGVTSYGELPVIGGNGSGAVSVSADGSSIVLESNVFKLAGFSAAETGAQPRKNAEGKLEWVVPAEVNVEELENAVSELQEQIKNTIDTIKIVDTELEVTDKAVSIPMGAGLQASEEITIGEDGTLAIGTINFSKIVQDNDVVISLDGGNANYTE